MDKLFYEILKEAIFINRLSQKQLAEKIHVSQQTLNSYLNGRSHFRIDDFCKVAHILNIDPNQVLGFHENDYSTTDIYMLHIFAMLTHEQKNAVHALMIHYQQNNHRKELHTK